MADIDAAGGDTDLERKAVATFVSRGGDKAIAQIRYHTTGEEEFLELDDSDTFSGLAGYREFEDAMESLERQASTEAFDAVHVFNSAKGLQVEELARLRDLQDYSKYPDLPLPLRAQEQKRAEENLARVESLLGVATAQLAKEGKADAILLPDMITSDGDNLADAQEGATRQREGMEDSYRTSRERRQMHEVTGSARKELGDSGVFGMFDTGQEYLVYLSIDALWGRAESDRRMGVEQEIQAQRQSLVVDLDAALLIGYWRSAEYFFGEARSTFDDIVERYDDIQERHHDVAGYWEASQLPEGA